MIEKVQFCQRCGERLSADGESCAYCDEGKRPPVFDEVCAYRPYERVPESIDVLSALFATGRFENARVKDMFLSRKGSEEFLVTFRFDVGKLRDPEASDAAPLREIEGKSLEITWQYFRDDYLVRPYNDHAKLVREFCETRTKSIAGTKLRWR